MRFLTFLAILGTFLLGSCEKEQSKLPRTIPEGCYHSNEAEQFYAEDAARLLLREIIKEGSNHPDYSEARLNSLEMGRVLSAFQAVINLRHPARDTVLTLFKIHTFPWESLNNIFIMVDPQAPAIKSLLAGVPTGNAVLDSVVNNFGFTKVDTLRSNAAYMTLETSQHLNLFPLINVLESLPFIYSASMNSGCCDGNNIELHRKANTLELNFSIGFGDCPAGCISRRHWVFEVDTNCVASFVKSYGT